jgi:hypothetical protein
LYSIFSLRSTSFVTFGLVLPLCHCQFLLFSLPSSARETCLRH